MLLEDSVCLNDDDACGEVKEGSAEKPEDDEPEQIDSLRLE